ncbi:TPA: radical SAM peptide maturase, CXXX-repeat target family [Streptococcus agalactiae]
MVSTNRGYFFGTGLKEWGNGEAYSITFVVTEECNLRCKYCYQVHKNSKKRMSFDIAKKAVDFIIENPDTFSAKSVIWDFIGGEPLLELELIEKICDYIKIKTYEENHPWAYNYRFSIGTNGTLYGSDLMRKFIKKNMNKSSVGITIDGTKLKHDLQRVYKDGKGSYEDVVKNIPLWLDEYPNSSTKVTFSNADLPYLKDSITHLWDLGIKNVPANIVFEDVWSEEDSIEYEKQLKLLADYVLDNGLWNRYNTTLFDENLGQPHTEKTLNSNFCGSGRMLAIDANGDLYPCIRFLDFSLTKKEPIKIGNIFTGLNNDAIRPFLALSTLSQSDEECINCEVAQGCAWCQGNNYDSSDNGTLYFRPKFICEMHKARCRANEYYWSKFFRITGLRRNQNRINKKHLYFIMADNCVEYCHYTSNDKSNNYMTSEIISKGIEFCRKNFYKPVVLHSKSKINNFNFDELAPIERIDLDKSDNILQGTIFDEIKVFSTSREILDYLNFQENVMDNCIYNIFGKDVKNMRFDVLNLLKRFNRVNINILDMNKTLDLNEYSKQLELICDGLTEYYKNNNLKEINVITDILFLDTMDNCNAGVDNFALAPNGKIYICPAFYFNDINSFIGDIYDEKLDLKTINKKLYMLENSPICNECDAFHCNRCIHLNKKCTNEYNIPGSFQCKKSNLEKNITYKFLEKLTDMKINTDGFNHISKNDYLDPLEKLLKKIDVNPYGKMC